MQHYLYMYLVIVDEINCKKNNMDRKVRGLLKSLTLLSHLEKWGTDDEYDEVMFWPLRLLYIAELEIPVTSLHSLFLLYQTNLVRRVAYGEITNILYNFTMGFIISHENVHCRSLRQKTKQIILTKVCLWRIWLETIFVVGWLVKKKQTHF